MPTPTRREVVAAWLSSKGNICQSCQREIMPGECFPFNPDPSIEAVILAAMQRIETHPRLKEALTHLHSVSLCYECHKDATTTYTKNDWRMQIHEGIVCWVKYPRRGNDPGTGHSVPGLQPGERVLHPGRELEPRKEGRVQ